MDAHANFGVSTVVTAPSPSTSGLSLVVGSGHGARFPATPFNAVVCPINTVPDPTNSEIIRVTGISSDTLTILRAQEGTTARSVTSGDLIYAAVTKKTLNDAEDPYLIRDVTLGSDGTFDESGLDQGFTDLIIKLNVRGTRAAIDDFLDIKLNNDATASAYDSFWTISATGTSRTSSAARVSGGMPAATADANAFGYIELEIPLYTGSFNKVVRFLGSHPVTKNTTDFYENGMFTWWNTAAVDRISAFGGITTNLKSGSRMRIFGRGRI